MKCATSGSLVRDAASGQDQRLAGDKAQVRIACAFDERLRVEPHDDFGKIERQVVDREDADCVVTVSSGAADTLVRARSIVPAATEPARKVPRRISAGGSFNDGKAAVGKKQAVGNAERFARPGPDPPQRALRVVKAGAAVQHPVIVDAYRLAGIEQEARRGK